MELEMKYTVPDMETADKILKDPDVIKAAGKSPFEDVNMKAVYFDTNDGLLSKNNMAVRVRSEGERKFATLKWGGHSSNGFHERGEVNIPVSEDQFEKLSADIFQCCEDGQALQAMIGSAALSNLLEMNYLRRKVKLHLGSSIAELAVDTGAIMTAAGEVPILELEIELFTGNKADIRKFGNMLAERYGLTPEDRSKLARGLAKMGKETGK